jgi:O-antigen ligase
MSERLAFGFGTSGQRGETPSRAAFHGPETAPGVAPVLPAPDRRERRDWAFTALMIFTALLFFRPQNEIPVLRYLHLAEVAAIFGLGALGMGRLGRGLTLTRLTPELVGVLALGGVILMTAPFSIWMGGAVGTFTDLYVKVLLIFLLMVNTLQTPKRIEQFTWLMVIATGYIAFRAVFDYARGINLIENGRVQGAVGGMFQNPNDLALNLVAVLPLSAGLALHSKTAFRRMAALGCALLMIAAIIASHSRSGTVGLAVMTVFLGVVFVRRRPGLVFAGILLFALALPLAPASYWNRIASITDASQDETGSREARRILLREAWNAFVAHPITGVGAGQFKNYKPEGRTEAWRETHNVLLQVASELGIIGLGVFMFLIVRGAAAGRQTRRLLRRARGAPGSRAGGEPTAAVVTKEESDYFELHAGAMAAALAGWFVCALFASVAYHWTFYYLLALAVAPREVLIDRLSTATAKRRSRAAAPLAVQEARA